MGSYFHMKALTKVVFNFAVWLDFPSSAGGKWTHLPMQETRDMGLINGLGKSSEEDMATHSSIFAWETSWTEDPGGL